MCLQPVDGEQHLSDVVGRYAMNKNLAVPYPDWQTHLAQHLNIRPIGRSNDRTNRSFGSSVTKRTGMRVTSLPVSKRQSIGSHRLQSPSRLDAHWVRSHLQFDSVGPVPRLEWDPSPSLSDGQFLLKCLSRPQPKQVVPARGIPLPLDLKLAVG